MANKYSVDTVFRGVDQMSPMFAGMSAKAKAFEKSLQSPLQSATALAEKPLGVMKQVGVAAIGAGVAAGAVFADLVSTGADFEKTMIAAGAKFSPAIRQGTKEFEELRLKAEEVGARTEFNAQQAAMGLKDLASAGFSSKQAIAALPGVVDLATASEVDLSAASEMATKSLGAFNLKTTDAVQLGKNLSRVNDVMSRTADATSASMEGLFQSILEGAPVATTAGASVETFMALAGQLAQSGIEASVAGTTLKNVFLTLAAPTKEAATALKLLGIETEDSKGNLRDTLDILGELEKKTSKMGTAKKAEVLEGIFGKIPIAGVSALLGGGIDKVAALRKELENATGSTATMAAIMRDSTQNDIDGFTSAIDGVKLAVFNVVKAPFREITQRVTEWTSANKDFAASGFSEFLNSAIPAVKGFGQGVEDSFLGADIATKGLRDSLGSVFGIDGDADPKAKAYQLAKAVTDATLVLGGFWLVTKAASAATFVYGAMTKGAAAAVWLYNGALTVGRGALVAWKFWQSANIATTLGLTQATLAMNAAMVQQRIAAFGAAGGLKMVAGAAALAGVAYMSYLAVKDQNDKLKSETEGLGFLDIAGGMVSKGTWDPFKVVDDHQNKLAKERRAKEDAAAKANAAAPQGHGQPLDLPGGMDQLGMARSPEEVLKQMAAMKDGQGQLPPDMMGFSTGFMAPAGPLNPDAKRAEPQIALKDESAAKLSQNLSRDVAMALKGNVMITIKDKGGNAEVESSTGSGVQVNQSGGF